MDPRGERAEQDRGGELDGKRRRAGALMAAGAPAGRGKRGPAGRELALAGRTASAGRFAGGNGVSEDDGALSAAGYQPCQRK